MAAQTPAAAYKLRKVPKLTAEQIALHGGITRHAHLFSLDAARGAVNTGMTAHERDHLVLMIANDLALMLAQEQPAQAEALLGLVAEIERASALWVSAWAKGEK